MLEVRDLRKSFRTPDGASAEVVSIREFVLGPGQERALRGESGCGKTTFLNLVAGILAADSGTILIGGQDMASLPEPARDGLRARRLGYIFQTFNLLQGYTVLENVVLGMSFSPGGANFDRARELLRRVGLAGRLSHYPRQLSTGQQQRVAIARALANRPQLVLADEPTGNLDRPNARQGLGLIREVCREEGAALLLVSHDEEALAQFASIDDFRSINLAAAVP
jgi:ABC-type lipoprotein export system ATPase subunit